jgi:hypothetical protein
MVRSLVRIAVVSCALVSVAGARLDSDVGPAGCGTEGVGEAGARRAGCSSGLRVEVGPILFEPLPADVTALSCPWPRDGQRSTWSARTSTACGMVRPSALDVRRFTSSSSFVGCSTGRSPGRAPFTILST